MRVDGHSAMPAGDKGTDRTTYLGGALGLGGAKPIEVARGRTISDVNVEILRRSGLRVSGRIVKPAAHEGSAAADPVMTSVYLRSLSVEAVTIMHPAQTTGDNFEFQDVMPVNTRSLR